MSDPRLRRDLLHLRPFDARKLRCHRSRLPRHVQTHHRRRDDRERLADIDRDAPRPRFFSFTAHGCVRPRSKELDPLRYDLRTLALAAAVLAFKFSRLQPAFNISLSSFAQVFCTGLSELPENHNIVPFDSLLAIAVLARKTFIGRNRKTRDRLTISGQISEFGILSEMANQLCSIKSLKRIERMEWLSVDYPAGDACAAATQRHRSV